MELMMRQLMLVQAAASGKIDLVKTLLDENVDIDTPLHNQRPLFMASMEGCYDVAKLLIDRGANVQCEAVTGASPLHVAATFGHMNICRLLIANGALIDARDNTNLTPLIQVCDRCSNTQTLKLLLDNGADVNAKDDDGDTGLHLAAASGRDFMIQLLVESGAHVDVPDKQGRTPRVKAFLKRHLELAQKLDRTAKLIAAAREDDINSVKICLSKKPIIVSQDSCGKSTLDYAICHNNVKIAEALLKFGAKDLFKSKFTHTSFIKSIAMGRLELAELILHYAIKEFKTIELLTDFVNNKSYLDGKTALHLAAMQNSRNLARLLIENGAIYDATDNSGKKPEDLAKKKLKSLFEPINIFFKAVRAGDRESVNAVIDKVIIETRCASLDERECTPHAIRVISGADTGLTALHIACSKGHKEVIGDLLGDVNRAKKLLSNEVKTYGEKRTALQMTSNQEIEDLLLARAVAINLN